MPICRRARASHVPGPVYQVTFHCSNGTIFTSSPCTHEEGMQMFDDVTAIGMGSMGYIGPKRARELLAEAADAWRSFAGKSNHAFTSPGGQDAETARRHAEEFDRRASSLVF